MRRSEGRCWRVEEGRGGSTAPALQKRVAQHHPRRVVIIVQHRLERLHRILPVLEPHEVCVVGNLVRRGVQILNLGVIHIVQRSAARSATQRQTSHAPTCIPRPVSHSLLFRNLRSSRCIKTGRWAAGMSALQKAAAQARGFRAHEPPPCRGLEGGGWSGGSPVSGSTRHCAPGGNWAPHRKDLLRGALERHYSLPEVPKLGRCVLLLQPVLFLLFFLRCMAKLLRHSWLPPQAQSPQV